MGLDYEKLINDMNKITSSEGHQEKRRRGEKRYRNVKAIVAKYEPRRKEVLAEYHAWADGKGLCVQCRNPDHDGICECGKWDKYPETEAVYEQLTAIEREKQQEIREILEREEGVE